MKCHLNIILKYLCHFVAGQKFGLQSEVVTENINTLFNEIIDQKSVWKAPVKYAA